MSPLRRDEPFAVLDRSHASFQTDPSRIRTQLPSLKTTNLQGESSAIAASVKSVFRSFAFSCCCNFDFRAGPISNVSDGKLVGCEFSLSSVL